MNNNKNIIILFVFVAKKSNYDLNQNELMHQKYSDFEDIYFPEYIEINFCVALCTSIKM